MGNYWSQTPPPLTEIVTVPSTDGMEDLGDYVYPDGRDGTALKFQYFLCPTCMWRNDHTIMRTVCSCCSKEIKSTHYSCGACSYRYERCMSCGCEMNGSPTSHADNLQFAYKRSLREWEDIALRLPPGATDRKVQLVHDHYAHLVALLQTKKTLREFFEASIPYLIQEKRAFLGT